jgi:hypothetical protein
VSDETVETTEELPIFATAEEIVGAYRRRVELRSVHGVGRLYLRELSTLDLAKLAPYLRKSREGDVEALALYDGMIAALGVVNAAGAPIFGEKDEEVKELIAALGHTKLQAIKREVESVSGMGEVAKRRRGERSAATSQPASS